MRRCRPFYGGADIALSLYSADGYEPAHIHVVKGDCEAKVWLNGCAVAINLRLHARDLRKIGEDISVDGMLPGAAEPQATA